MDFALKLTNVTKRFGAICAVDAINLTVAPGELVGIVGPDGAGKTTVARLAAGVIAPSAGKVEPKARGRVGYLTGRFSLYPELSVRQNLCFFAKVYGMNPTQIREEAPRLLDWVGLLEFKNRPAGALSGGMRQKLALACAIIHRPPMLILDEPTTAVDPVARADFWNLLQEQACQGCAVLITTPYMDEAENCQRVLLLLQGRTLATGAAVDLKTQLPYRMALLTPQGDVVQQRAALSAAACDLPGHRWHIPLGGCVRVALDPAAPLAAPDGYTLADSPTSLEDIFVWLSGKEQEVARP